MTLSIVAKQSCIYIVLIVSTAIGSIYTYMSARKDWVTFRAAENKYENKEYSAAIALYKQSIEEGLNASKVTVNLAHSYVATGNFKEAIALYRQYLPDHPKDSKVRLALARALSWNGNLEESETEYQILLENSHENHQDL